ncbi:hypothetical protein ONZ45_g6804 [Pleurotus djamor]|nr:hypothetical protein ONZ45_g6804 [Pleurotus djamor]
MTTPRHRKRLTNFNFGLLFLSSTLFNLNNIQSAAARSPWSAGLAAARSELNTWIPNSLSKRVNVDTMPNGTNYIWLISDVLDASNFFDNVFFFNHPDPTRGTVNYVNRDRAFERRLAYTENNKVILKSDNTTTLPLGTYRESVRVETYKNWDTGLFILDVDKAPWGCGIWPAFWTIGKSGDWPYVGEIDIIEGVHDNQHNQVTWHTGPGCHLTPNATFTGTVVERDGEQHLDCDGTLNGNPGCGITEWSRASYGPLFDAQGGGVYAMKWDEFGIAVWSFYRAAIPQDIIDGSPRPSGWGPPVAALDPAGCNITQHFANHAVIFSNTFCG